MSAPRLEMHGLVRRFGATAALQGVDLSVQAGEVHALLGENGAGKSTLMKILAGALRADAGSMRLDGAAYAPSGPLAARAAGVAIVYQELNLAPHLTVEENLVLGVEQHTLGVIRSRRWRARVIEVLQRLHRPEIRPEIPVRKLSPAARQLVEIARALLADARVLILDEPTSSLGLADTEHLFQLVRALAARGVSVIYISHFLEEVRAVADRYTVLRDGRSVGAGALAQTGTSRLVEQMVGRKLEEMFPRVEHAPGAPILEVESLAGRRLPASASFTLHRGEILGIAGLVGAGRSELLRALFGLEPVRRGAVRIGTAAARPGPAWRLRQGVGLLSEDRKLEGLALSRSVEDNLLLSDLGRYARLGWLRRRHMRAATTEWMQRLGVKARSPEQRAGELSGGNQQKLALARLLHHDVDVLLLDEPTRGVDVASKAQIYQLIGALAARGKAVLMVSSYTPELLGVCDRIAVMHRGRLGPARPAAEWSEAAILEAAASGKGIAA
ncbi:MAG: sugar ABC transporter ATP-binding protein [Planctomycetota bacterium]|nr:MAG: sugar ABC transporter ATP-binding protein [Planctomycetota bacterium]